VTTDFGSRLTQQSLELLLLLVPVLVISMVLHEIAHAYVANRLGDPTARMLGRLTLNPLKHVDPMGTAMFAITYLTSGFMFGWAKPIPVQPRFFNRPHQDMAIVAIAGPLVNLVIAWLTAVVGIHLIPDATGTLAEFVSLAFATNVLLAVFNMMPIPPLDGSRVLAAVMPKEMAEAWGRLDQFGFIIIFGLLFLFPPFYKLITAIRLPVQDLLIRLAGG
jgi:Zn-dependent protease